MADRSFTVMTSVRLVITGEQFYAACRAHWPSWDRMRPDHQSKWRVKMIQAFRAVGVEVQW